MRIILKLTDKSQSLLGFCMCFSYCDFKVICGLVKILCRKCFEILIFVKTKSSFWFVISSFSEKKNIVNIDIQFYCSYLFSSSKFPHKSLD